MSAKVKATKVNKEFCVFVPIDLLQLHTAVPYNELSQNRSLDL